MIRSHTTTGRTLTYHGAAGLLAMVVVGLLSLLLAHRVAADEADRDSRGVARSLASGLVAPLVTAGVRSGDKAELATLDRVVRTRISTSTVVRVKVWSEDGSVLYSDAPGLIGRRFPLDERELAFKEGVNSELSSLNHPENIYEEGLGPLLEVYVLAEDATGQPVLVETYLSVDRLREAEDRLQRGLLPLMAAVLGGAALILVPVPLWLARQIHHADVARLAAEVEATEAAAAERRLLATHLHDGVIQDLTAVGFGLHSALRDLHEPVRDVGSVTSLLERTRDIVRDDVAALRGLTSTLYTGPGQHLDLHSAVVALARDLVPTGAPCRIADVLPEVGPLAVAGLVQIAREALRNAARHSGADPGLVLEERSGHVVLEIRDHGAGFTVETVGGPLEGHLGLTLLRDAAARIGGELEIVTAPGEGTLVRLSLPVATVDTEDLLHTVVTRNP